ncbi:MAG: hypothetical protein HYT76_05750, partial [Deltaproteobacteria bacterium]|nr:hypothetical protein [Deltaproteobacteria bacterium]
MPFSRLTLCFLLLFFSLTMSLVGGCLGSKGSDPSSGVSADSSADCFGESADDSVLSAS